MSKPTISKQCYRVIQWATGTVGQVSIRHFVGNPVFELVGVLVTNPAKVGKHAGELADIGATGVIATDDVETIIAMNADCVHYAPLVPDLDVICRLLRSGKNVVSPLGPFYRTERYRADVEKIEAACKDGGTSFHGSGIQPGYVGDLLPLTLARLVGKIDKIHVYELVNFRKHPNIYIQSMGFGRDPADVKAKPSRSPEAAHHLEQSMTQLVEALGGKIEKVTTDIQLAAATKDIPYATGVIPAGTVAGQRYEWTAWVNGAPLVKFYAIWTMGDEDIDCDWGCAESIYRVVIEGDPASEIILQGLMGADGIRSYPGLDWTALAGVNVIPQVCDAAPGFITHLDLGVVRLRGQVNS